MASRRDYYEILGVARDAGADAVKKAYRKIAVANHPDRNPGDEAAVERFKEASEAYEVLSNPEKRSRYDRFGHAGLSGNGAGFADVGDIFSAFGDIFGDIFGGLGGATRGGGRRPQRGASLRTAVTIELRDAARGCERTIEIPRQELCSTCDGSGAEPGTQPETCDYCAGHGRIVQSQGFFRVQTTCPACRGEGRIVRDPCKACRGSGREERRVKLNVTIPAGVDNGMQLRVRGEGEPGDNGGPRGDLHVDIHVNRHPFFEREGVHLICDLPITYTQAALGTRLEVPLLEGRRELEIPPGTQPGERFTLRGEGMPDPHGGRAGNLFVDVHLEVPRKLTERQEELLRELAEIEHSQVSPHRRSFFEKLKDYFSPHHETADND